MSILGFHDIKQIERMPLREYYLRIEAFQIKEAREREKLALLAWFNQSVQATTGSDENPQPKFKKFNDFYNIETAVDEIRSAFEDGYISHKEIQQSIEQRNAELIKKRRQEFMAMKARKEEKHE